MNSLFTIHSRVQNFDHDGSTLYPLSIEVSTSREKGLREGEEREDLFDAIPQEHKG